MPLFFIVSGFFTAMLWRKRGALALLSHRFRRVLLPCLVGTITVVPLCTIAITVAMSSGAARRAAAVKAQAPEESIWAAIRQSRTDIVEQHLDQGDARMHNVELNIEPLAYRVKDFCRLIGISASKALPGKE